MGVRAVACSSFASSLLEYLCKRYGAVILATKSQIFNIGQTKIKVVPLNRGDLSNHFVILKDMS